MPKVDKISEGIFRYKCECGTDIELHVNQGEKLKRLVRCFQCQYPIEWLFENLED